MSRFISKRFDKLEEYVPGEQPTDQKYVKLNTNESPYQPSDSVIAAATAAARDLQLYPDPECSALVNALSDLFGVEPQNIVLGNGSDEILNFCFAAYCDENKGAAFPNFTYGFYSVFAQLYNIDYTEIPLKNDFNVNIEDYFNIGKTVFIANPNAPTGIALSLCDIERILQNNPNDIVVIDEAYVDFGAQSAISLIDKYDNLVVVGTFSKSRSLAGARLGFAVAAAPLIRDLNKLRYSTNPYNINRVTLAAGLAAVNDNDYYMNNCKKIIATRAETVEALENLNFTVLPSSANFVFAKYNGNVSGGEIYRTLKQKGVLVRHFDKSGIDEYLRITIGSDEQMNILFDRLKEILI